MRRLLTVVILACACGENLTLPPERDPYVAASPAPLECVPNLDGRIDADELVVGFGAAVSYRVNPADEPRAVDLAGLMDSQGRRVWDWSDDVATDQELAVRAAAPGDRWYAGSFPDAEFVAPLDAAGLIEGVYSRNDSAVLLHGYASRDEEPAEGQTLVVYTQPVTVYALPLEEGAEWVSTGEVVDGRIRDLPYAGTDVYHTRVSGTGELWLPELRFEQVLQVRTELTVTPAVGQGFTRKQVGYVFECFGEVARAVSADNETQENFDEAVELRRLGL